MLAIISKAVAAKNDLTGKEKTKKFEDVISLSKKPWNNKMQNLGGFLSPNSLGTIKCKWLILEVFPTGLISGGQSILAALLSRFDDFYTSSV